MALFTQDELEDAVPELDQLLALDDDEDGVADSGLFDRVLSNATSWIEGYLEQAGLTLDDPPPSRLKHLGMRYAEYNMWSRRQQIERAKQIYEQWIKPGIEWLEKIANGVETLEPAATSAAGDVISEGARTYSSSGDLMA